VHALLRRSAPTWIGVGVGIGIGIEPQHELQARATGYTVREDTTEYAVVGIDPDADSDSDPETENERVLTNFPAVPEPGIVVR